MGNTLNINIAVLKEKIGTLRDKRDDLSSYSPTKCDTNSSGLSNDKLKNIESLYENLRKEIVNLYNNTISYMNGISQQIEEMDTSISESMNAGG